MMALIAIVLAGIALLMVIGVGIAILGALFGLVFAALAAFFKVLPLLIIGWVAVKLIRRFEGRRGTLRGADAAWLDTRG
jgi:predicted lipid-binding transport protein (Tim44 family)